MQQQYKLLIIDDSAEELKVLKDRLEKEGYKVLTAFDGVSGINTAGSELPDLIFCDVMMPGMDGYEVMKKLGSNPRTAVIPFIFLTAMGESNEIRKGMISGADDYIVKPFTPEDLLKVIKIRLEKKEAFEKKINMLKESISYSLPHELQTPLTVILGFSDILVGDYDSITKEQLKEIAGSIKESGERLKGIVKRLLYVLQLDSILLDNHEIARLRNSGIIEVESIISKCVAEKMTEYGKAGRLNLDIEEGRINIKKSYFISMFCEIVDNAFKFSGKEDPVSITGKKENGWYCLYVMDSGRGMTQEEVTVISEFMQFKRINYEQPGTGLGLAIAKKIVEIFNGEFYIESKPFEQTLVKISFPLNEAAK